MRSIVPGRGVTLLFAVRVLAFACLLAHSPLCFSQQPLLLTNLSQVPQLGNEKIASGGYRVQARGTIIFVTPQLTRFYLQDGDAVAYVDSTSQITTLHAGQEVEVTGTPKEGWLMPSILGHQIRPLGTTNWPAAREVPIPALNAGAEQGKLVKVRGKVRDMIIQGNSLVMLVVGQGIDFRVMAKLPDGGGFPREWMDADIEVTGMNRAVSDNFGNSFGFLVYQHTTNQTTILNPGYPNLFGQPVISISAASRLPSSTTHRVKVKGRVIAHSPGELLYVQDQTGIMRVELLALLPKDVLGGRYLPHQPQTLVPAGTEVEVIAAPVRGRFSTPTLIAGEFRRTGRTTTIHPLEVGAADLAAGAYPGQLVTLRARLLDRRTWSERRIHRELLLLESGGVVFQSQWRGDAPFTWNAGESEYVQLTGAIELELGEWQKLRSFTIILRDGQDVRPAAAPHLWERTELRKPFAWALTGLVFLGFIFYSQRRQMILTRASEERFRALLENSFDVTVVMAASGDIKYMSPAGYALLGIAAKDRANPRRIWDIMHPEALDSVRRTFDQLLQMPGKPRTVSGCRIITAQGSVRYADAIAANCLHVPGVYGIVVNIRDVTERKQAADQLERAALIQAKLNEFATSLSPLHDEDDILWEITRKCIFVLGFEDCVIYLLDEPRRMLVQRAAYGPKNPREREILAPIEIPIGKGIVGFVGASGVAEIIEDTRNDPRYIMDDCMRLSEITVPITADGRVLGIIDSEHSQAGFFTAEHLTILSSIASICANKLVRARAEQKLRDLNISLERLVESRTAELRAINEQLRQSEEKFSKAFRASPIIIAIARVSDGRFLDVNEAFLESLGLTREQVIGHTSMEINVWQSPEQRDAFISELMRTGHIRNRDMVVLKNGEPRQLSLSADIIEIASEPCIVSVSEDITEKREAEKELLRSLARERELSQLKSSFVATISHEFRTPLGVILSSADILSRYWERLPEESRREHLADVQESALEMARQMENVLVFGRAEANRLEYSPAQVHLPGLAARVADQLATAEGKQCILINAEHNFPLMRADEALLTHILSNLISNAIKYSPPHSPIEVFLGVEEIRAYLTVKDHGLGIPEKDRATLFNPFYRGSNVGRVRGTGMGLAIVKRCAETHHGEVILVSEEGKGTSVTVRWPFQAIEQPALAI